jgi:oligopeptidase A
MAPSTKRVNEFLEELRVASRPYAEKEYEEIRSFAKESGFNQDLLHWDVSFWSERYLEQKLGLDEEVTKPYFQLPKVLNGLFDICHKLFGIHVEESKDNIDVWHDDVKFYNIFRDNQKIASFFLDPYSRPANKRGGAWMGECVSKRTIDGNQKIPVAYLVCNGAPPVGDKPSLMKFSEVITLFHEFGHGLQHMLTTINYGEASGINGVEWDAVELPSQFMENWCYHKPTVMAMTEHVETGDKLPDELFEKLLLNKVFMAGSGMLRQLTFAITDMTLHSQKEIKDIDEVFKLYQQVAKTTSVLEPRPEDRFLCAFSHIFAGGYSAGYYSYKWAEVLSADAFSAFEDAGLDNDEAVKEVGEKFRNTVLGLGGSLAPMDVFVQFRGREPSTKPLLRHCGLM